MRSKKQIIKIMISTLLLLSCMILFVGCGNSKPQSAANNSTDTPQNDNADSNARLEHFKVPFVKVSADDIAGIGSLKDCLDTLFDLLEYLVIASCC